MSEKTCVTWKCQNTYHITCQHMCQMKAWACQNAHQMKVSKRISEENVKQGVGIYGRWFVRTTVSCCIATFVSVQMSEQMSKCNRRSMEDEPWGFMRLFFLSGHVSSDCHSEGRSKQSNSCQGSRTKKLFSLLKEENIPPGNVVARDFFYMEMVCLFMKRRG